MNRERSVGAVVLLDLPGQERRAIVQIRAADDSFPGCAQITIHGKVQKGESLRDALQRETHEEIREMFERVSMPPPPELEQLVEHPSQDLHVVGRASDARKQVASLSLTVRNPHIIDFLRPLIAENVIRLISSADLQQIVVINPRDPDQKKNGVRSGLLGMFEDERAVLHHLLVEEH